MFLLLSVNWKSGSNFENTNLYFQTRVDENYFSGSWQNGRRGRTARHRRDTAISTARTDRQTDRKIRTDRLKPVTSLCCEQSNWSIYETILTSHFRVSDPTQSWGARGCFIPMIHLFFHVFCSQRLCRMIHLNTSQSHATWNTTQFFLIEFYRICGIYRVVSIVILKMKIT